MDALVMCGGRGTRLESTTEKPLHPIADIPMIERVLGALSASRVDRLFAAVSPHAPETHALLERLEIATETTTETTTEIATTTETTTESGAPGGPNGGTRSPPTVTVVETPGDGYVADLQHALSNSAVRPPVLTVAADLPLLTGAAVDGVLDGYGGCGSMTVCTPVALKRRLGASIDSRLESRPHLVPTGVNVVGDTSERTENTGNRPEMKTKTKTKTMTKTITHVRYDRRLAINVNRRTDAALAEEVLSCD